MGRAWLRTAATTALEVVGAAAVVYGLWQIWHPLAWVVGGALVIYGAWRLS